MKRRVKNRFISKNGRVISDISKIAKTLALSGFLVTVDIEKAFDSVNLCFLFQVFIRKFGFSIDFVGWIKTILKNQESCVINRGKTTKYFKLEKHTGEGYPISDTLFILFSEISFIFVTNNLKIKDLNMLKYGFLYTCLCK